MLDVTLFLPDIDPMTPADLEALSWKGALAHIGPLSDFTPLQDTLQGKTNCALYLLYMGAIGFCIRRTHTVFEQKLTQRLVEQIFCYQFDWRYAKRFGITVDSIDDRKDRVRAIQRSLAYFFFEILKRSPSFFFPGRPTADISFMLNLTRHLLGGTNAPIYENWLKQIITRLDRIAPFDEYPSPSVYDYPDRTEWEVATLRTHGTPLPPEVLSLEFDPSAVDLPALAADHLRQIDPAANPLLTPPDLLIEQGFKGTPYRAGG